jgi:hypothetical protein
MKIYVSLLRHINEFFLELEIFQTKVAKKMKKKKHTLFFSPKKLRSLRENVQIHGKA